jgi:hypothetical protein
MADKVDSAEAETSTLLGGEADKVDANAEDNANPENQEDRTLDFEGEEKKPEGKEDNSDDDGKDENKDKDDKEDGEEKEEKEIEYEEFNLPEGMPLDKELLEEFLPIAKEGKLSQEVAQKMVDLQAKAIAKQVEAYQKQVDSWAQDAMKDKEFGGDKFQENVAVAIKARDKFSSPELTQLLNETGYGNHPEMIRLFYKIGKAISEDSPVFGKTGHINQGGNRDESGNPILNFDKGV